MTNSKLITNYRDKTNEVKFVCNALRENDYPDWLLNKVKKEIKHKKVNKSNCMSKKIYNYVGLPYIKGLSNEMSRILRKFNINVYIYPYKTIGNILAKIKDSVDIYISGLQFIKFRVKIVRMYVYVGETGKCLNTRLSKHKCDLKPINLAKLKKDDLNKKLHWLNIVLIVSIGLILGIWKY